MDALQSTGVDRLDLPYYDPEQLLSGMESLRAEAADYQARLQAATFAEQGWRWDDETQQWVQNTEEEGAAATGETAAAAAQWSDATAGDSAEKSATAAAVAAVSSEPPVPGLEEEPPVPGDDTHLLPPGVDAEAPAAGNDFSDEMAAFYSDADVTTSAQAAGATATSDVTTNEVSTE